MLKLRSCFSRLKGILGTAVIEPESSNADGITIEVRIGPYQVWPKMLVGNLVVSTSHSKMKELVIPVYVVKQ